MLRKLQIAEYISWFKSRPKFVLFENAANFQVKGTLPNHPCNFYIFENEISKQFYCIRHNLLPDKERSILMIEAEGEWNSEDLKTGLEQLSNLEPALSKIGLFIGSTQLAEKSTEILTKLHPNMRQIGWWPCQLFHVSSSDFPKILEIPEPELDTNMTLDDTRVEDAQIVTDTWKFATSDEVLQQREKLLRLPTSCIFHNNSPVSFEMVGLHGQLSHQYTFPEYRNRGLGTIVEVSLVKKCIKRGIHPYKCVELDNKLVLKRSAENDMWNTVKENENPLIIVYVGFSR